MTSYLDTHAAIWLFEGKNRKFTRKALNQVERSELRISPIVLLEVQYLREVGQTKCLPEQLAFKLNAELGVEICNMALPVVVEFAINEGWTREPFDRLIVAHAHANGVAPLISADRHIAANYPNTIW